MRFGPEKVLDCGSEHSVAELDSSTLIKWPKRGRVGHPVKTHQEMVRDLGMLKDLKVPMPSTTVYGRSEIDLGSEQFEVPYCVVSEKKDGSHVTWRDFERPEVKLDFSVMLKASQHLEASLGLSLDMFGTLTSLRACIPDKVLSVNLLVCDEGLLLVDPSLRVINSPQSVRRFMRMQIITAAQNAFGNSILFGSSGTH